MKFRSMILVLTIAFSAIFASMLGTSYAYYVSTDGTSIDVTTGNIDVGTVVTFEESQYINIYNAVPGQEYSNNFEITLNSDILDGKEYVVSIGVTDIYIDDELKTEDFKITIECTSPNEWGEWTVGNKTGVSFTNEVIQNDYLLLGQFNHWEEGLVFELDKPDSCNLIVKLEETGKNQNHLMNKKFRGLIKVNTLFK